MPSTFLSSGRTRCAGRLTCPNAAPFRYAHSAMTIGSDTPRNARQNAASASDGSSAAPAVSNAPAASASASRRNAKARTGPKPPN